MSAKKNNLGKMLTYYKPYMKIFWADMFFATLSAGVALVIPLIIRYVTKDLIYTDRDTIVGQIPYIAILLFSLLIIDLFSKFFIGNYGHVMGPRLNMICEPRYLLICRNCHFHIMMTLRWVVL